MLLHALQLLMLPLYLLMSGMCFALYGVDKYAASHGLRRIPEMTLHILEFLCGWPGALLGQSIFRHKTQKQSFRRMFWLAVAANILLLLGFELL